MKASFYCPYAEMVVDATLVEVPPQFKVSLGLDDFGREWFGVRDWPQDCKYYTFTYFVETKDKKKKEVKGFSLLVQHSDGSWSVNTRPVNVTLNV